MADFSLITANGSQGNGPASFSVKGKDGLYYEYGIGGNSQVLATGKSTVSTWMLREIRDRSNNRVRFTYAPPATGLTGTTHPTSIEWTATSHGAETFQYNVTFAYGSNVSESAPIGYLAGTLVADDRLLSTITVSDGGNVVRRYSLNYQNSPTTGAKRLQTITECSDAAGINCLTPTTISYQNGQPGLNASATPIAQGGITMVCDLNGDGIEDMLYTASASQLYVAWGSQNGPGGVTPVGVAASAGNTALVGDIRGTGQNTLLVAQAGFWHSYHWNGSSFISSGSTGVSYSASNVYFLADANGDGKMDLFKNPPNQVLTYRLSVSTSATVNFAGAETTALPPGYLLNIHREQQSGTRRRVDFNGDGREDLFASYVDEGWQFIPEWNEWVCYGKYTQVYALLAQTSGVYSPTPMWEEYLSGDCSGGVTLFATIDSNDDSCTDVALDSTVLVTACDGTAASTHVLPGMFRGNLDWDGDGRQDALSTGGGSFLVLNRSTGQGFASPVTTAIPANCTAAVIDLNGDGLDDVACNSGGTWYFYPHNGAGTTPDLATSFVDGYGVASTINYISAPWGNYTKQSDSVSPIYDYAAPMQLVASVQHTDGIGGSYTSSYWWFGGARNRERRTFASFAKRRVTDSRSGIYFVDYYERAFPYSGRLIKSEAYQPDNTLIRRQVFAMNFMSLESAPGNQRYFVYEEGSTTYSYEVGGSANGQLIRESGSGRVYDQWGNATQVATYIKDLDVNSPYYYPGYGWSSITWYSYSPDVNNWCLGLPVESSTNAYHGTAYGTPLLIDYATFTNNSGMCRLSSKEEHAWPYGTQNRRVNTSYSYDDPFGNVTSISVTGYGSGGVAMSPRVSYVTWGSSNGSAGGTGQFPVTITDPLSKNTHRTYNSTFGSLATEIDPNNVAVANNQYDSLGRLSVTALPDGTAITYDYYDCIAQSWCSDARNRMIVRISTRDTAQVVTPVRWVYLDQFDRPIIGYDRLLDGYSRFDTDYDAIGRVSRQSVPCRDGSCLQYWVANSYDLVGRLISQSRPLSESNGTPVTTTFGYVGGTHTTTDPQSRITTKIFDARGMLRRSQDHNGYYQSFEYDQAGSLLQVTDSLQNTLFTATYSYGIRAFQDTIYDMDLGPRTYLYNSLGELTAWSDATHSFSQTFDALSRVTSRSDPEGTTYWTWGNSASAKNIGRLAGVSMPGYSETFSYDGIGRLANNTVTTDQPYSIDYAYNPTQGHLETLTYPTSTPGSRFKVKYGYQYGILSSVSDWSSGSFGGSFWVANAQNPRGQITQETFGNGVVTTRSYDAVSGWLNSIQSGVNGGSGLQNESYLHDLVGNITQRQESNLGLTENFYYDNLYRLDYSQLNGVTNLDMTYGDPEGKMGNITSRWDPVSGSTSWSYHATKKHAVSSAGAGTSYAYDADGNMISRNGFAIDWTSYNYPQVIRGPGETATFSYGPDRQYYKLVHDGPLGVETTHYTGNLLEKVQSGSDTDWRHYVLANGNVVAVVSRKSGGGGATVHYPLQDHLGSPAVQTSSSGTTVVRQSHGAFGLPRNGSSWAGAVPSGDQNAISGITKRGYTGHTMLASMGLVHMNGRVMDASIGQFISPDPFVTSPGFTQGWNRFAYVTNNPLTLTDPSGFAGANPNDFGVGICDTPEAVFYPQCDTGLPAQEVWNCREPLVRIVSNGRHGCIDISFNDPNSGAGVLLNSPGGGGGSSSSNTSVGLLPQSQRCYAPPISLAEQQASDRGDRRSFWSSRESRGDPMGAIGMAVVDDTFGLGRAANARLREALVYRDFYDRKIVDGSVASTNAEMNQIGIEIMRAHVNVVRTFGTVTPVQSADYHFQVFGAHDLPRNTFGGAPFFGTRLESRISSPLWLNCQ